MNIIKPGKLNEQLKRVKEQPTIRFRCTLCGCEFEANSSEYSVKCYTEGLKYVCECPYCDFDVFVGII